MVFPPQPPATSFAVISPPYWSNQALTSNSPIVSLFMTFHFGPRVPEMSGRSTGRGLSLCVMYLSGCIICSVESGGSRGRVNSCKTLLLLHLLGEVHSFFVRGQPAVPLRRRNE